MKGQRRRRWSYIKKHRVRVDTLVFLCDYVTWRYCVRIPTGLDIAYRDSVHRVVQIVQRHRGYSAAYIVVL